MPFEHRNGSKPDHSATILQLNGRSDRSASAQTLSDAPDAHPSPQPVLAPRAVTSPPQQWSDSVEGVLDQPPSTLPQRLLLGGFAFCCLFGIWAWMGQINEVGYAQGRLVPKGETFKINPLELGKVVTIAVQEGQSVKAGQLLLVLDNQLASDEVIRLEHLLVSAQTELSQKQLLLEKASLQAQSLTTISQAEVHAHQVMIAQAQANAENISELLANNQTDIASHKARLERLIPLVEAGAIAQERLFEVEQELHNRQNTIIKSQGDLNQQWAEAERLQAGLTQKQAEGRKNQLEAQQQMQQLAGQITQLQGKIAETQTLLDSAKTKFQQRSLYAPIDGIVSTLNIRNIGEVVQPGQPIAEISRANAPTILLASLPSREAGFVKSGMPVQIKFDAYPYQDHGVVSGKVISTSADSKQDEKLGAIYRVEIALDRNYVTANQQKIQFKPGQTATAEIITRRRRIVDILLDPIRQLQKGGISL